MHELEKFQEWVDKTNNYSEKSSNTLIYHCEKIIDWGNRVKETDLEKYLSKVKELEEKTIKNCLSKIYDEYLEYLYDADKHGDYTKVKQTKIMIFIYYFDTHFVPILDHINNKTYTEDAADRIQKKYLHNIFYDLKNIDEYHLISLLSFIDLGIEKYEEWGELKTLVEKAILSKKDANMVSEDLNGESEEVDYKVEVPDTKQIAKLIASFASTKGGRIYVGVDDSGNVTGLNMTDKEFDQFKNRVSNITADSITPPIEVSVSEFIVGKKIFIRIKVPKGSEPLYYVNDRPYIRVLTTSRPAKINEIKQKYLDYFINSILTQFNKER